MPQAIIGKSTTVDTSWDNIVIHNCFETVKGGRTLDVTGITETTLKAGRIIIMESGTQDMKPLAISGDAYAALPAGHEYKGVLVASILTALPFAAIMKRGTVNQAAAEKSGLPASIPAAAQTALSLIPFTKD